MPLLVAQRRRAGEGAQPVSQEPFCGGLSSRTLPILSARDRRLLHLALFVLIKGGFQPRREKEEACGPVLYEPFCPHCPPQLGPWERRAVGDGSEPFTVLPLAAP